MNFPKVSVPLALPPAPVPGVYVFATLSFMESIARALVVTLMTLQSYELLKSAQNVSYLTTFVGLFGFVAGLLIPLIIRGITRRWTYTLGALALIASALCLYSYTVPTQVAGVTLRSFGTACLNITANLYMLDYIRKHQFVRVDSLRMVGATTGWTFGPFLGVWLAEHYGLGFTYGLCIGLTLMLIAYFWYLRMSDQSVIIPARHPPGNPLRYIPRFVSQPRLRLAWLIAFGRSAFWSTLFTYAPILMVEAGQSRESGGLVISIANLTLLTAVAWGFWAERRGVKLITIVCYVAMAACLMLVGFWTRSNPWLAAAMLVVTSIFASGLDAVGGVPFYRAVRHRERPQMTAVYRNYIDFSDLLPSIVYGVLLGFFGLESVFVALGVFQLVVAAVCWRYIPRSL